MARKEGHDRGVRRGRRAMAAKHGKVEQRAAAATANADRSWALPPKLPGQILSGFQADAFDERISEHEDFRGPLIDAVRIVEAETIGVIEYRLSILRAKQDSLILNADQHRRWQLLLVQRNIQSIDCAARRQALFGTVA